MKPHWVVRDKEGHIKFDTDWMEFAEHLVSKKFGSWTKFVGSENNGVRMFVAAVYENPQSAFRMYLNKEDTVTLEIF